MSLELEMDLAVSLADWQEAIPDIEGLCRRAAMATINTAAKDDLKNQAIEVGFLLTDDEAVQELNRDYRGKDKPTNVLSFASQDGDDMAQPEDAPIILGDIVMAFETVVLESEEENKTIANHFCHLVVHGMLHLLGFDHQNDREAFEMESLESTILIELGIPDPYGDHPLS